MIRRPFITGWRRLIGSLRLQIIFHKRATKCRSLLRKMTYKDKGSYESSLPCRSVTWLQHRTALQVWHDSKCDIIRRTFRWCVCGTTLQGILHTAPHCNTLHHTATHCNTLQHTATRCNTLQHTATHCNTLQHTATHCNTLQGIAPENIRCVCVRVCVCVCVYEEFVFHLHRACVEKKASKKNYAVQHTWSTTHSNS